VQWEAIVTRVEQHAHARHWVFRALDRLIDQQRDAERPASKEWSHELLLSEHQAPGLSTRSDY